MSNLSSRLKRLQSLLPKADQPVACADSPGVPDAVYWLLMGAIRQERLHEAFTTREMTVHLDELDLPEATKRDLKKNLEKDVWKGDPDPQFVTPEEYGEMREWIDNNYSALWNLPEDADFRQRVWTLRHVLTTEPCSAHSWYAALVAQVLRDRYPLE